MEILDMQGLIQLHIKKFGVGPVITGARRFDNSSSITERIANAIESGKPYIEPPVEDGVLI